MHNEAELLAETYRLKLEQQKSLGEIRRTWKEIKEKGDPAILATEALISAIAGKSSAGKTLLNAADILLRHLKKK